MLKILEQRVVPWLLIAAITGGVVLYREMGEVKVMVETISTSTVSAATENRGEIRRLNNHIMNHERSRHGRETE